MNSPIDHLLLTDERLDQSILEIYRRSLSDTIQVLEAQLRDANRRLIQINNMLVGSGKQKSSSLKQ